MRTIILCLLLGLSGCGIFGGSDATLACIDSDEDLCNRLGKDCGVLQAEDQCGVDRTVVCGTCERPLTCGGDGTTNVCGCVSESDKSVCERDLKNCGSFTTEDDCGQTRTVACGRCDGGQICGDEIDNVCGCPCRIDGVCYAENQDNPLNPCEVCSPSVSATAWTARSLGEACDDRDNCTENETCDATGLCSGSPKVCPSPSCQIGVCSAITGECETTPDLDGSTCEGDGASCTTGLCANGSCVETRVDDFCLIDDVCFRDLDVNPQNDCERCDSILNPGTWSGRPDDIACDGSVTACDTGVCGGGVCQTVLLPNRCIIDNTCYLAGDKNPANPCEICNPELSGLAWSNDDGASCNDMDNILCTAGVCDLGVCEPEILDTFCLVGGICFNNRERKNVTSCEICVSGVSKTSFGVQPQNAFCNINLSCRCGAGDICRDTNGVACPGI